jgi:hypothetical protein
MSEVQRHYKRWRVLVILLLIGGVVMADHIGSPTFRMNMGEGGLETTLTQRQSQTSACAPCGAPCRPED